MTSVRQSVPKETQPQAIREELDCHTVSCRASVHIMIQSAAHKTNALWAHSGGMTDNHRIITIDK